jgi:hypothetical protein
VGGSPETVAPGGEIAASRDGPSVVTPAPAVERRGVAAVIGPRVGVASGITKPPWPPVAAVRGAAGLATEPDAPGSGLGGCLPSGCAHTSDAISPAGHPLVLPAVLAVRPDVRGLLVAPPTGPAFPGRLPGVAPLPG